MAEATETSGPIYARVTPKGFALVQEAMIQCRLRGVDEMDGETWNFVASSLDQNMVDEWERWCEWMAVPLKSDAAAEQFHMMFEGANR